MYTGYEIAFDGGGLWSFHNDFAGNVLIFGVDNSSSSHADNRKNNFLVLGEGLTYDINGSFGAAENKFSINFTEAKTKFCLSLHYNGGNSYFFVSRKEICEFKTYNGNVNYPTQFCLGNISNEFDDVDSKKVSLKGNVYDFAVYYNAIVKSNI